MTKLGIKILDFKKENLFNYLELGNEKIKIESNYIEINIDKSNIKTYDHYIEILKLYKNNKNDYKTFKIDLYLNKINIYYCFINSENNFSFDIIIYKNYGEMLNYFEIINNNINYKLEECNKFGLKRCRKYGIINCDKNFNDKYQIHFPSHIKSGSYYLNILYPKINNNNNNINNKISIQKIKEFKIYDLNFTNISNEDKDFLINLRTNVMNEYNNCILNINNKELKEIKSIFSEYLQKIINYNLIIPELKKVQYLLARNKLINLSKDQYEICFGYILYIIIEKIAKYVNAIVLFDLVNKLINNLETNLDKHNNNILKILIWYYYTYILNEYFTDNVHKISGLFTPENYNDFKLIFLEKTKKNTPYFNAYNFLINFIDNLNEDSYLLEILYFFDSNSSGNRIYKNCSTFKFSLLSLEQIKQHLKLLIPKVIIRFKESKNNYSNGSYLFKHGLIRIYENSLFKLGKDLDKYLIEKEDINCIYSIPLILFLIHESFCHGKTKLDFQENDSPNSFYDPHDDYNLIYHCSDGESGRLFEYYISPDKEIIRFLKYSFVSLPELLNVKLWTGKDLNDLIKLIKKKQKENNIIFSEQDEVSYFPDNNFNYFENATNNNNYESERYSSLDEDYIDDDSKMQKSKRKKKYEKNCK